MHAWNTNTNKHQRLCCLFDIKSYTNLYLCYSLLIFFFLSLSSGRQVITTLQIFTTIKCWSKCKSTVQRSPTHRFHSGYPTICWSVRNVCVCISHSLSLSFSRFFFFPILISITFCHGVTKCQWNLFAARMDGSSHRLLCSILCKLCFRRTNLVQLNKQTVYYNWF